MRILFVSNNLPVGGIERAMLDNVSLLQEMGHTVDILLREKEGGFLFQIPAGVVVYELPLSRMDRYEVRHGRVQTLKHCLVRGHFFFAARMIFYRLRWVLSGKKRSYDFDIVRCAVRRAPRIKLPNYDLAIAYFADGPWSTLITLEWAPARKKITWCHSERALCRYDHQLYRDFYSHFDGHYACSNASADRINRALSAPRLVKLFPHLVDRETILRKGQCIPESPLNSNECSILTVGRICEQKGPDIAVRVCARLRDAGLTFKWYWIGGGPAEDVAKLQLLIEQEQLQGIFVCLGSLDNPYPYFKACDIYVQPSRYEGFCLTIAEAKVFQKPIVATDFDGAREQLEDGVSGMIVPEEDEVALQRATEEMICDTSWRTRCSAAGSSGQMNTRANVIAKWEGLLSFL